MPSCSTRSAGLVFLRCTGGNHHSQETSHWLVSVKENPLRFPSRGIFECCLESLAKIPAPVSTARIPNQQGPRPSTCSPSRKSGTCHQLHALVREESHSPIPPLLRKVWSKEPAEQTFKLWESNSLDRAMWTNMDFLPQRSEGSEGLSRRCCPCFSRPGCHWRRLEWLPCLRSAASSIGRNLEKHQPLTTCGACHLLVPAIWAHVVRGC